tara:strand:+ start:55 stop:1122 length:1068 start_codon:yes stop_codon:yes gene_type:complete
MAFLDNSGDIILDAVLTDLGRKRMAEGNFRITQFSLGDDEIDYGLYNKDHPSGSAYFDLEILQTPVFEAFTRTNANINYGLLSYNGRDDLLYLPTIKLNQLRPKGIGLVLHDQLAYLAVNEQTYNELIDASAIGDTDKVGLALSAGTVDIAGIAGNTGVPSRDLYLFETGLDSNNDPARTKENQTNYITQFGLMDNEFTISCDRRFITGLQGIDPSSMFMFPSQQGTQIQINLGANMLQPNNNTSLDYHSSFIVGSILNQTYQSSEQISDLTYSSINGPRARVTAFFPSIAPSLISNSTSTATPAYFSLFGNVNQNLFGDGNTYDYLDTVIYIRGNTTGVSTQLILRIIRANTIA